MRVQNGFYFTFVGFLFLTCVESLITTNKNTDSEHGSVTMNGESVKSHWKLTTDLDTTFNTFKRKDHIDKKHKQLSNKVKTLQKDESGHIIGLSKEDVQQQISKTQNLKPENTKRQYIFGAPALIPAGAIPHRFAAFPNPGLHTGACRHHVCYHGGVCVRTSHGFYCDCPEQYLGQHCEFKRACLDNPCKNAGTCTELGQGEFSCTCAVGSKGKACELKDSCVPNPCNNEAVCTEMDDSYHCTCKLGYKGDRCQNKAFCFPNPCKNGATCIDRNDRQFECSCALGFKGDLCEVFSECKNSPCVNGGTCIEKAVGYQCACLKAFVGKNCEVTLCNPNPCANNGKCSVMGNGYNCACAGQYTGKHCEVLNPCRTSPCLNGGECVVSELASGYTNDGFSCKCPKGYYGNMCQMR